MQKLKYPDAPAKGMKLRDAGWVFWRIDAKLRPHHDVVLRDFYPKDEILTKTTFRTPKDLQIVDFQRFGVCSSDIRDAISNHIGWNEDTLVYLYDKSAQEWKMDIRDWERQCGEIGGRNPMRDYEEVPERMRVTGTNPACKVAPTAKQFQGYEGMSVQLCPASKPWPKDFKFAGAQDVVDFAKSVGMVDDLRERIYAIYCDQKNIPLGYRLVSSGGVTETVADPKVIFQPAAALSAPVIFMVHNHPSGAPAPSPMDNALTERLKRVAEYRGFRLVDHLVVGTQGFYSYADEGKL